MKRIILAFPMNGAGAKNVSLHLPLSCLYIATVVNQEYEVKIFDQRLQDIEEFISLMNEETLDNDSNELSEKLIYLWKKHDFTNIKWKNLHEKYLEIIHNNFGKDAF